MASEFALHTCSGLDMVWELLHELGYEFSEGEITKKGLLKTTISNEEGVVVATTEELPQDVADRGYAYALGYFQGYNNIKRDNPFKFERDEYYDYGAGFERGKMDIIHKEHEEAQNA